MADELDIELILALAEGTLPEPEAAAAEAALDATGRAELAMQRLALEALHEAPEPVLTATERDELRTSVRDAINLAPAPVPARPRARAPWYARAFPALAGLAALVIVVGVGLNLGSDDDAADGAGETTAAAVSQQSGTLKLETAETSARTDIAATEEPMAESAAAAADDAGGDVASESAPATTAAAAADAGIAEFRYGYVGDLTSRSGDLLEAMDVYAEVYSGGIPLEIGQAAAYFAGVDQASCWEGALEMVTAPDAPVLAVLSAGFGRWDGQPAEFYEFLRENNQIVAVLLVDECTVLATEVR